MNITFPSHINVVIGGFTTSNITLRTRNNVVSLFPCLDVNRPYMFIDPIYLMGLYFLNIYQMLQKGSKVL